MCIRDRIVAVVRPDVGFGKVAIYAECRKRKDTQGHLPDVIVGDVVFQVVVVARIKFTSALLDFFQ